MSAFLYLNLFGGFSVWDDVRSFTQPSWPRATSLVSAVIVSVLLSRSSSPWWLQRLGSMEPSWPSATSLDFSGL